MNLKETTTCPSDVGLNTEVFVGHVVGNSEAVRRFCFGLSNKQRVLFGLIIGLASCQHTPYRSPKEEFFTKHPELKASYKVFAEASFPVIEECARQEEQGRLSLLNAFKRQATNGFPSTEYFAYVRERIKDDYEGVVEMVNSLSQGYDEEKDSLFYFSYETNEGQEQGWIVIRGGEIRKKCSLGSSLPRSPSDSGNLKGTEAGGRSGGVVRGKEKE